MYLKIKFDFLFGRFKKGKNVMLEINFFLKSKTVGMSKGERRDRGRGERRYVRKRVERDSGTHCVSGVNPSMGWWVHQIGIIFLKIHLFPFYNFLSLYFLISFPLMT